MQQQKILLKGGEKMKKRKEYILLEEMIHTQYEIMITAKLNEMISVNLEKMFYAKLDEMITADVEEMLAQLEKKTIVF